MHAPSNPELVQEFILHLRVERGLSHNTLQAYTTDLWQYAEVLEQLSVTIFTADTPQVRAFFEHLDKHEIEPISRARKLAALRTLYKWLIKHERLEKDPTRLIPSLKVRKTLPRYVELDTLDEILDRVGKRAAADDATPYELRDYAMISALYGAGLRVSEMCNLRQSDLTLSTGMAIVRGKGNKERMVPLGDDAVAAIENYLRFGRPHLAKGGKGQQRALFLSEQGTQITQRRVRQVVARAGGDVHLYPHKLRHSCATHMMNNKADLRVVQELLGHATLATTQIYTHVSKGHLQQAHARSHPRGRGQ